MTVYVDELTEYAPEQIKPAARRYGVWWSHLTADSVAELVAFAGRLGLAARHIQVAPRPEFTHFDLIPSMRRRAVALGAVEVAGREHFGGLLAEIKAREAAAEATPASEGGGTG